MAGKTLLFLAITALFLPGFKASEEEENFAVELTVETFDDAIAKNNHFVKFFAPWCGDCKRLHPLWEQLAEMMNVKDEPQVVIAKVDCTKQQAVCVKHAFHDFNGYPTLRFFKLGETESVKYKGTRDMPAITEFINEQINTENEILDEENKEAETVQEAVKGKLVELTEENFAKHVSSGNHFVKFYAPWCSHCQRLAPTWEELAKNLKNDQTVSISKIDCTVYRPICQDFEVKGYPTLLWIEDGKKIEKYSGSRGLEELNTYVKKMLGSGDDREASTTEKPTSDEQDEIQVLQLTGDSFHESIANGVTFVKFYAPWCGHCQKLSPVWDQLAEKIHKNHKDIRVAKVDCTSADNKKLCIDQQVEGYPTLFAYKNGERQGEYDESRSLPELVSYISKFGAASHDEL